MNTGSDVMAATGIDSQSGSAISNADGCLKQPKTSWELLALARSVQGHLALSSKGPRLADTSKPYAALAMNRIMRAELALGLAAALNETDAAVVPADCSQVARIQGALNAMGRECADLIDTFCVDNEDSLIGLTRACLEALQAMQICGTAGDLARVEMTKVLWRAQSAAQAKIGRSRLTSRILSIS